MENFSCKTRILTGTGALSALGELKSSRALIVTDPYFIRSGLAGRVGELTKAQHVEIFDGVEPDPSVELAARATALAEKFQPDLIVALGGGSALDCAKAVRYFLKKTVYLAAVPTTSGSGSEVTDFAILTHGGVKHPLVDERLQPELAILDGELLQKLPPTLIADAGFDVLSHALEALVAAGAGGFTDALAADSFCTVYRLLHRSYKGDGSVRLEIHRAASMAGLAFNQAGLGLCHGMSHALGGAFHVAHGRLNGILLPHVLEYNCPQAMGIYARTARRAGIAGVSDTLAFRGLKNGLIKLRRELDMPGTLPQAGVDPGRLREKTEAIVEAVMEDPCCRTNPVAVTPRGVRQILEEISHG